MALALLDTDTLSELLKQRNHQVVTHAADNLRLHGQFALSVFTRFEIARGYKEKGATALLARFWEFCRHSLVVPLSDAIFDQAEDLWAAARRGGHAHIDADLIIAATAMEGGRTLVTGNTAHFRRIPGLVLEDWRKPEERQWRLQTSFGRLHTTAAIGPPVAPFRESAPPCPVDSPMLDLKQYIRSIPDFPKPGIMFRDITPLLSHPVAFQESVDRIVERFRHSRINVIAAAEARGFIFAAPVALALHAAFVPVRKPGKLPFDTSAFHYELEYGKDTLEMHTDAVNPGDRVLLVDDLLATGGTINACVQLVERSGAEVVGCAFAIELTFLKGRDRLVPRECFSVIEYDDEN